MIKYSLLLITIIAICTSCSSSKTYFSHDIKTRVEANGIPLTKLQYYVDRDIELRREIDKDETKVKAGKVKFQDGKYLNIITLKKNTPGVCIASYPDKILVSFEPGNKSYLTFGRTKTAKDEDPYRLLAIKWEDDYGMITYDGDQYYIQPEGSEASLVVTTSELSKSETSTRKMRGRTVE
jgi:hypothetical protein